MTAATNIRTDWPGVREQTPPAGAVTWMRLLPFVLATLVVGVIDWYNGANVSSMAFFILPIMLATWRLGGTAGFFVLTLTAATWIAVNLLDATRPEEFRGWLLIWNWVQRTAIFAAVWFLMVQVRTVRFRQTRLLSSDPLTGMDTRQSFIRGVGAALSAARQSGRAVAMLLVDVDQLRAINLRSGQSRGDLVLQSLSQALWTAANPHEVVGRVSDDGFALLMLDVDQAGAMARVAAVRNLLAKAHGSGPESATFSTALITAALAPIGAEALLQAAEDLNAESLAGVVSGNVHRVFETPSPVTAA